MDQEALQKGDCRLRQSGTVLQHPERNQGSDGREASHQRGEEGVLYLCGISDRQAAEQQPDQFAGAWGDGGTFGIQGQEPGRDRGGGAGTLSWKRRSGASGGLLFGLHRFPGTARRRYRTKLPFRAF